MAKEKPILVKIDGKLIDLPAAMPVEGESIYPDSPEALEVYRHSASHLLAQAVMELYPGVQYGIGPAVEDGFYYDFLTPSPFTPDDLKNISKRMAEIVKKNMKISRQIWTRKQTLEYFSAAGQALKSELVKEKVEGDEVSLYRQGDFVDLCRGPHLPSTSLLKHFALLSIAAAYWKGDEKNQSMQRIYGTVFPDAEGLQKHLQLIKEAQERDHRRLGKALDLFSIHEEAGPGLIYWHPYGGRIRHCIETYWKSRHYEGGYELLYTPHIGREWLWQTSGHLRYYKDSMYSPMEIDKVNYYLKPMNCPFHIMIYKSGLRSYRELPLRWAELGTVYRYERSGVLHGLMRVRGFTQDDAHIICTPEQMEDEILRVLDFSIDILKAFGFIEYKIELAVRDPKDSSKYVGSDEMWRAAEASLLKALTFRHLKHQRMEGEAVFYGPKIDIKIKDALGRTWQCTTIQFDFNNPELFEMKYIGADGAGHRPYMIHRALLGSMERFFGILIEHYAGFFPVWLSPVQAIVLPVTEVQLGYAERVLSRLHEAGIRAEIERRNESVGKKIREAETRKIPFIVIVGEQEEKEGNVSLRVHRQGDRGPRDLASLCRSINKLSEDKSSGYEV